MLRSAYWRPVAVCALIRLVCLSAVCPANGQDLRPLPDIESTLLGDYFLSAQPADNAADDTAAPKATAPEPKEVPPTVKRIPPPPPRTSPPSRQPSRQPDITSMLASRGPMIRLAGLPNMFGDSYGSQIQVCDFAGCGVVDIPPPGGTRRVKISENDKALPMDRVFFNYNHFQNAIEADVVGLGVQSFPIDQYTIGLEKTFRDGLWSVELRLPFSRTPRVAGTNLDIGCGDVGNLAITLKRLLYASQTTAVGIGLPIEAPTGDDVTGQGFASTFTLSNDAVHLAPFIGYLHMPNDRVFCQGFLQLDFATHDNRVRFGDSELGRLPEQTLLYVDYAMGYWLLRNLHARYLTGLAAIVEYHYTTTLEDAEMVGGTDGYQYLQFGNTYNRLDISNITLGVHAELGLTTIRLGGAFPLGGGSNRLYDAEIQLSVNRRY